MRTCKECKYWTRYESSMLNAAHFGSCQHDAFIYDVSHFENTAGFYYWDYEGYSAGFSTGEDFGCIHGQYDEAP